MVRRGGDLVLEGVCAFAFAEVCRRDRVRPRSDEEEGMGGFGENWSKFQRGMGCQKMTEFEVDLKRV